MNKIKKVIKKIKEGFVKEAFRQIIWIYALVNKHKKGLLAYSAISMVSMLITTFFSVQIKGVIDYLLAENWMKIMTLLLIYIIVGLVNVVLSVGGQRLSATINIKVRSDLCAKTYSKLVHAKWEQLAEFDSGDMLTRIQEDVSTVAGSTVGWVPSVIINTVQVLLALGVILYYDASMLVVIILVAPILLASSRIFLGKTYFSNREQRTAASNLTSLYKETFTNLQSIKAFGLQETFCEKEAVVQRQKADKDLDVNKYSLLSWSVMYVCGQFVALICLGWAVYHIYTGVITLGTMALILVMEGLISSNFKSLIQMIPTAMGTITAAERVQAMLALEEEKDINDDIEKLKKDALQYGLGMKVENLSFSYHNGKKVFDHANFEVPQGQTVALVGASGEGKTTMLRLLLCIVAGQQGGTYFTLKNKKRKLSVSTRKLIAYVPQGNTMMHGTIRENIAMMKPEASDEEIIEALKKACAYEFVQKLPNQLDYEIGEAGIGFSEGQNQRLAIARALLCDAPVLLLDEATSALDVATERMLLRNLMEKTGRKTCILTTHRPSVLSMCDRVYQISDKKMRQLQMKEIEQLMREF